MFTKLSNDKQPADLSDLCIRTYCRRRPRTELNKKNLYSRDSSPEENVESLIEHAALLRNLTVSSTAVRFVRKKEGAI